MDCRRPDVTSSLLHLVLGFRGNEDSRSSTGSLLPQQSLRLSLSRECWGHGRGSTASTGTRGNSGCVDQNNWFPALPVLCCVFLLCGQTWWARTWIWLHSWERPRCPSLSLRGLDGWCPLTWSSQTV